MNENFALGGAYLKAKNAAFQFFKEKTKYFNAEKKKDDICEILGQAPSSYNVIISGVIVSSALGLGGAEIYNSRESLQGMGFSEPASIVIGAIIAGIALYGGHEIAKGMQERDPFSNRRVYNKHFYFGVLLCCFNLGFQFFLSRFASDGGGSSMIFYNILVVIIGILEIFVGAALKSAILTLTYWFSNLRQRFMFKRMYRYAKRTEGYWQRYLFDVAKATIPVTPEPPTPLIEQALEFYNKGGF